MVRVVGMADTHCAHEEIVVPPGDILVHAGDALCDGTEREAQAFLAWFATLPHAIKIYVPGNHDEIFFWKELTARGLVPPGVLVLIGEAATVDGYIEVFGAPWVPGGRPDPKWEGRPTATAFALPDAPRGALWAAMPAVVDILVCHAPPLAAARADGDHIVDQMISRARPRLVVCGHIHRARGIYEVRHEVDGETVAHTVVMNAACCGPPPDFEALAPLVVDI